MEVDIPEVSEAAIQEATQEVIQEAVVLIPVAMEQTSSAEDTEAMEVTTALMPTTATIIVITLAVETWAMVIMAVTSLRTATPNHKVFLQGIVATTESD
jgi:hypothetical protein